MNELFVGLDVSSLKLDACFMTNESEILLEAEFQNDLNGANAIKYEILSLNKAHSFKRIVIGMESTSMYSFHPSMFFQLDEDFQELPLEVTIENPFRIKQYFKMFDQDKTDKVDAKIIADYLRVNLHTVSPIKEEVYIALQRLTRSRYQLVTQRAEAKMHFIENLTYKCNTLKKELKGSDDDDEESSTSVFGAAIMSLFTEELTIDEFSEMPLEEASELLQKLGRNRFKDPVKVVKSIRKAVNSSYRLGKVASESIDLVLSVIANEIKTLNSQIKVLDNGIERLMETIPEAQCLMSVPGVGPVYAAGMIAEIGQIERFDTQAKLAKYAGLVWKKKQSGNYESENTPMTHTGNKYFRYYVVEATNSIRKHTPEFREFYNKKKKEVPKHQHKRALVLTARKFVRLVDVLLRNHQIYTPQGVSVDK
jgi:transposase